MSSGPVQLSPQSEEFLRIQYLLQLSQQSYQFKDLNIWAFGNPMITVQFEKRAANLLTLDSWVDFSTLDDKLNSVENILTRGFQFPPGKVGRRFTVGNLNKPHGFSGPSQFLLCKIAVGRSYVLDEKNNSTDLPKGYDSFYVHKAADNDGDGKVTEDEFKISATHSGRDPSLYHHEYHIFDPTQVQVQYLIHFNMKPRPVKSVPVCIHCEVEEAVVYCKADDAYLCASCDEITHSHNTLVQRHVRTPIDSKGMLTDSSKSKLANIQAKLGSRFDVSARCSVHDKQVEYFCPLCHVPVCVQCKMVGSHSSGDAATHKLIPISDAYEGAIIESARNDPILEGRRATIEEHLNALDNKLLEVNKNSAEVEEQIYQLLQDTLFKLQDKTQQKMNILLGEELELRRQLEQLDWVELFLENQRERLGVVEFLETWARHVKLRSVLHSFKYTSPLALVEVHPDITLTGSIDILTNSTPNASNTVLKMNNQPLSSPAKLDGSTHNNGTTALRENLLNSKLTSSNNVMNNYNYMTSPASDNIVANVKRDMRTGNTTGYNGGAYKMTVSGTPGLYHDTDDLSEVSDYTRSISEYGGPYSKGDEMWNSSLKKHIMGGGNSTITSASLASLSLDGIVPGNMIPTNYPVSPDNESTMSEATSKKPSGKYGAYSLKRLAARRKRALSDVMVDRAFIFNGSKILSDFNDADLIYNVLPISGGKDKVLETKLIYSSLQNGRTMSQLHEALESFPGHNCPTITIIKTRAYVFGGYASDYWNDSGERFGTTQCFLFSLNHGVKIPYHGRQKDEKSKGNSRGDPYGYTSGGASQNTDALCGTYKSIQFGIRDLIIKENLLCSSELECSYGIGMKQGSNDALTFLAGSQDFDAEVVEIWAIGTGFSNDISRSNYTESEASAYRRY